MARIAPYAEVHKAPQGPGDARPTATKIIEDQGLHKGNAWSGRTVLITGCSPESLGEEAAKAIHLTGADIFITVRDVAVGKTVANNILADGKPGKVEVITMELDSLKSVRAAAAAFLAKSDKLHVLINNAGVMAVPNRQLTKEGFEAHLGINHLGHFLLFSLLKDALLRSSTPDFNSRVVSVSSAAHRRVTGLDFEDLQFERREYVAINAYGESKLANVHFANEIDRQFQGQGLRAVSLHPGGIPVTGIARHQGTKDEISAFLQGDAGLWSIMKSVSQGAATTVWAAVAKELEGRGGIYLDDVAEAELYVGEPEAYHLPGYSGSAFDEANEKKLWAVSTALTKDS